MESVVKPGVDNIYFANTCDQVRTAMQSVLWHKGIPLVVRHYETIAYVFGIADVNLFALFRLFVSLLPPSKEVFFMLHYFFKQKYSTVRYHGLQSFILLFYFWLSINLHMNYVVSNTCFMVGVYLVAAFYF